MLMTLCLCYHLVCVVEDDFEDMPAEMWPLLVYIAGHILHVFDKHFKPDYCQVFLENTNKKYYPSSDLVNLTVR